MPSIDDLRRQYADAVREDAENLEALVDLIWREVERCVSKRLTSYEVSNTSVARMWRDLAHEEPGPDLHGRLRDALHAKGLDVDFAPRSTGPGESDTFMTLSGWDR
jgi:hypothetical protein